MADPRVVVLGAGSAGTRHADNLRALGAVVDVVDTDPAAAAPPEPWGLDECDGVVVASPTACHAGHARAALAAGAHVLVEKPLATSCGEIDGLVGGVADGRLTVGYNLRFHAPVLRVRELLREGRAGRPARVRLWFGHDLAAWRPGVDYRATYSARSDLGGGILLDASHELDLLLWLFGPRWTVEAAVLERRSALEIDVEDTVEADLRSADGATATVSLDCVSPQYRRGIEVAGDAGTVRLDWATGEITVEGPDGPARERAGTPVAESYVAEARAFLDQVAGRAGPAVPGAEAARALALCDEIRRVAGS